MTNANYRIFTSFAQVSHIWLYIRSFLQNPVSHCEQGASSESNVPVCCVVDWERSCLRAYAGKGKFRNLFSPIYVIFKMLLLNRTIAYELRASRHSESTRVHICIFIHFAHQLTVLYWTKPSKWVIKKSNWAKEQQFKFHSIPLYVYGWDNLVEISLISRYLVGNTQTHTKRLIVSHFEFFSFVALMQHHHS